MATNATEMSEWGNILNNFKKKKKKNPNHKTPFALLPSCTWDTASQNSKSSRIIFTEQEKGSVSHHNLTCFPDIALITVIPPSPPDYCSFSIISAFKRKLKYSLRGDPGLEKKNKIRLGSVVIKKESVTSEKSPQMGSMEGQVFFSLIIIVFSCLLKPEVRDLMKKIPNKTWWRQSRKLP